MSQQTQRTQEELELKLAKQDEICRQENSDSADARWLRRGLAEAEGLPRRKFDLVTA